MKDLMFDFLKRKEKDLNEMINLLNFLDKKISNSSIKHEIEEIISRRIILEAEQIKVLKSIANEKLKNLEKQNQEQKK